MFTEYKMELNEPGRRELMLQKQIFLTVGKFIKQCPQPQLFKAKKSRIGEPNGRPSAFQRNALPLGQTSSHSGFLQRDPNFCVRGTHRGVETLLTTMALVAARLDAGVILVVTV